MGRSKTFRWIAVAALGLFCLPQCASYRGHRDTRLTQKRSKQAQQLLVRSD
jgi:hypothetical protein